VCSHYNIDPLKLISSGSMIMAIDDSKAEYLLEKLRAEGLEAENIGNLVNGEKVIVKSGVRTVIESPESDELYKVID
jgi:hydrogenase expression/formation protein HypE